MRTAARRPKTWENDPLPRKAFSLGFGPLLRPDPPLRSPPRSGLGHFSALIPSQDRPLGPKTDLSGTKTPKTANLRPKSSPRPPS